VCSATLVCVFEFSLVLEWVILGAGELVRLTVTFTYKCYQKTTKLQMDKLHCFQLS
jgi:hypothetical protein